MLEHWIFKVLTKVLCLLQNNLVDPQISAVVDVQLGRRSRSQLIFLETFMIL